MQTYNRFIINKNIFNQLYIYFEILVLYINIYYMIRHKNLRYKFFTLLARKNFNFYLDNLAFYNTIIIN